MYAVEFIGKNWFIPNLTYISGVARLFCLRAKFQNWFSLITIQESWFEICFDFLEYLLCQMLPACIAKKCFSLKLVNKIQYTWRYEPRPLKCSCLIPLAIFSNWMSRFPKCRLLLLLLGCLIKISITTQRKSTEYQWEKKGRK